jgi:replicative DNA helicase
LKYGAATQIVIMEYNQQEKKLQVLNRIEIPKGEYTFDNAVNKIIEINEVYRPQMIYIDRGFGEYQIEVLRKYGAKHPESGLAKSIRPVSFSEVKELIDPVAKTKDKKPIKPFMVNQLQILFERDRIWISEYDEMIIRQLENYQVVRQTEKTIVFTSEDEHALDCMMLCVLGFVEKYPEIMETIIPVTYASKAAGLSVKARNLLEENVMADKNDPSTILAKEWDEPGAPPPKQVPVGTKKGRAKNKSFSWAERGTNTRRQHKRKSW